MGKYIIEVDVDDERMEQLDAFCGSMKKALETVGATDVKTHMLREGVADGDVFDGYIVQKRDLDVDRWLYVCQTLDEEVGWIVLEALAEHRRVDRERMRIVGFNGVTLQWMNRRTVLGS